MKTFRFSCILVLSALFVAAAFGSEVYRNDFSTRTSKKSVPDNRWHETIYVKGAIVNNYDNGGAIDPQAPYADLGAYQDAWFKVYTSSTDAQPDVLIRPSSTIKEADLKPSDPQNPYLSVKGTGTVNVATPIYNDFSSGVVRVSCDIRVFAGLAANTAYVRVRPVFKKNLVFGSSDTATYVTTFGPWRQDVEQEGGGTVVERHACLISVDTAGSTSPVNITQTLEKGHWYRYEVELNLDAQCESGCLYDLGEEHPTGETAGVLVNTFHRRNEKGEDVTELPFLHNVDETTGPISGLQLSFSKVKSADSEGKLDLSIAPAVDNLKVEWKAPSAADFESVYENDFATRRYRTVCPEGTTAHEYRMTAQVCMHKVNSSYDSDPTKTSPNLYVPAMKDKTPQDVGVDGWRRIAGGKVKLAAVDWSKSTVDETGGDGGAVLRATGSATSGSTDFAYAISPLGETLTSGKVCFRADVRLPSQWAAASGLSRYDVGLMLCDAAAYEKSSLTGHFAVRGGISGVSSDKKNSTDVFQPYGTDSNGYVTDDTKRVAGAQWYRIEVSADLSKSTDGASVKVWTLGKKSHKSSYVPQDADLVYSLENTALRTTLTDISMMAFYVSGVDDASDGNKCVCLDNFVVTRDAGTENAREIYLNVFSSRTRTLNLNALSLTGTINNDDGADGWIARGTSTGEARVVGGAGAAHAAAWSVGNEGTYAVHPLGKPVKKGVFQVDIRPPKSWNEAKASTRQLTVAVGGEDLLQGYHDAANSRNYTYAAGMTFGFIDKASTADGCGVYTNMQLFVWNGNGTSSTARQYPKVNGGVLTSHWYRFRAIFDCTGSDVGSWSLKVYDMGMAAPGADDPDGTEVASKDDMTFRCQPLRSLSAYYLTSRGNVPVLVSDPEDLGMTLCDNVIVTEEDRGMTVILR